MSNKDRKVTATRKLARKSKRLERKLNELQMRTLIEAFAKQY